MQSLATRFAAHFDIIEVGSVGSLPDMTEFLDPRFISISELSRRKASVEKCYKVVNDYGEKTMGGQASSASDGAEKLI